MYDLCEIQEVAEHFQVTLSRTVAELNQTIQSSVKSEFPENSNEMTYSEI